MKSGTSTLTREKTPQGDEIAMTPFTPRPRAKNGSESPQRARVSRSNGRAKSKPVAEQSIDVPRQWPADSVERRPIAELVPYARNARTHSDEQIAELARAMAEWGWTNPILVDEAGRIIAGHGRVLAAALLKLDSIPVMTARGWSEAQKNAYTIADNQLALHASWDFELLRVELDELRSVHDFDLGLIGFNADDLDDVFAAASRLDHSTNYTQLIKTPLYTPKGEQPALAALVNRARTDALVAEIEAAESITDDERAFLVAAAQRHTVFDYHKIAEFYCHASPALQGLMEASALVIIDFQQAIERGFVQMSDRIDSMYGTGSGDGSQDGSDGDDA